MENKKGYAKNHHIITFDPNITFRDCWVYRALQAFRNGKTARCYPSYAKLIQRSGEKIGLTALHESVTNLEKSGWLIVKRRKGYSNYFEFPLLPLRPSEGGGSLERTTPHRSSAYKQEVVTRKYNEQEWQMPIEEKPEEGKEKRSARELMLEGRETARAKILAERSKIQEKMTMPYTATPNDFDGYDETDLREDDTGDD